MFRELLRKKKKLPLEECIRLLETETRGVLSVLGDEGYPYGMPMNHWYEQEDGKLYFHCGKAGHRLDALKKENKVSFCVYDQGYRQEGEWALNVKSVIVFGKIEILNDEKKLRRSPPSSAANSPKTRNTSAKRSRPSPATPCFWS